MTDERMQLKTLLEKSAGSDFLSTLAAIYPRTE
jgi:hypothetical protein